MDPLKIFDEWIEEARSKGEPLAEKMVLATSTRDGKPSARFLLWKERRAREFYFYTNYESRKAEELSENPRGALVFFWEKTNKQCRIEGHIRKTSALDSDRYWATRPRESQIGAWASHQSSVINSRQEIENQMVKYSKQFEGNPIPRPEFWGGYIVEAQNIEFWTGHEYRVHDREVFRWDGNSWVLSRLSP